MDAIVLAAARASSALRAIWRRESCLTQTAAGIDVAAERERVLGGGVECRDALAALAREHALTHLARAANEALLAGTTG